MRGSPGGKAPRGVAPWLAAGEPGGVGAGVVSVSRRIDVCVLPSYVDTRRYMPIHAVRRLHTAAHAVRRCHNATAGVRRCYRRQADHPTERAARPRDREHRFCVCESAVAVWGAGLCPATGDAGLGCMAGDAVRLERVQNLTKSETSAAQPFDKYTPACGGLPGGRPPEA